MRFALLLTAFFLSAQGLPIPQDAGMVESPPLVPESSSAGPSMAESGQVSALPVSGSESGSAPETAPEAPATEAPAAEAPAAAPESAPEAPSTEAPAASSASSESATDASS